MEIPSSERLEDVFNRACDLAARETLPRFRATGDISNKLAAGYDPVTDADREAERVIRQLIGEQFPDHGIIGEEYGTTKPDATLQWIIDPIDGTRAFVSGLPVWGTLIGLYCEGEPVAGVMDQPFTQERFMALPYEKGTRSRFSRASSRPQAMKTSAVDRLGEATVMTTSPFLFSQEEKERYGRVEDAVRMARYGCDCYAYAMLALGQIEFVLETGLNIYDIAALLPIIEGAGGVVSAWDGGSAARGGTVVAAANRKLHEQVLDILATG